MLMMGHYPNVIYCQTTMFILYTSLAPVFLPNLITINLIWHIHNIERWSTGLVTVAFEG